MSQPPEDPPPPRRRPLYEAAHKLPYEAPASTGAEDGGGPVPTHRAPRSRVPEEPRPAGAAPRPWERVPRAGEASREPVPEQQDVVLHTGKLLLALGALGVVYGDLGTSPLYTVQVLMTYKAARAADATTMYGLISLIFWGMTIVISVKYAGVIMRVHNRGDGGIMALAALARRLRVSHTVLFVTLGIFGASLFFGDGVITPAISVLSAVSGLNVATPGLSHLVVPISIAILLLLFGFQRMGTGAVGGLFGPIMLLWFACLALLGLQEVIRHPGVLQALSPVWGVRFFANHGAEAFLALGGVVLALTGAEALYADRGHFGAAPIRFAWFGIVFPGVFLNYLGQAALVLAHPHDRVNPFFLLAPSWAQIPMVLLATVATVIASQAVISGSYSVAKQAMQMGYLPRLRIVHTSLMEGQIYVPMVNWLLAAGVVGLVLAFQSSTALSNAYGLAVTGTFVLNTILFLAVARAIWHPSSWKLAPLGALFLIVEVAFFSANAAKILQGAWFPLVLGVAISVVMLTWDRGRAVVTANRLAKEGNLIEFLSTLDEAEPPIRRVPGTAVYLNPGRDTTPLALRAGIEHTHALHEKVLIVCVREVSVPRVDEERRFQVERLGPDDFSIRYVEVRVGYREQPNVPMALRLARRDLLLERDLDLEHASYFVSRISVSTDKDSPMRRWQAKLFVSIARNAASAIEHFDLPADRTVSIGAQVNA
ncbi:MAG TPA: KUP/HAK/KT family potassium transporter [Solirubrobacteraceae bacterium]|nr:KUP/HAK/KT family potassium transporter [Solirubrobacteraceae bacterium]